MHRSDKYRGRYDKIYKRRPAAAYRRRRDLYEAISQYVWEGDSVLDIGCGEGMILNIIADRISSYIGVDFSHEAIELRKKRKGVIEKIPHHKLICANVLEEERIFKVDYDLAMITEFLEHIEEDIYVIQRIREDKRVIISVPNMEETKGGKPRNWPLHRRVYDKNTFLERYSKYFKKKFDIDVVRNWIVFSGIRNNFEQKFKYR